MSLPVIEPPMEGGDDPGSDAEDGPVVAGVLLAAGRSSRFGPANKLLAEIDGVPVVRRAAEALEDARIDFVVAVLGHDRDEVRTALDDLDGTFVENPDYHEGQATSVRAGIEAVRERADAAVFALGDMPFVEPESVNALIRAYRRDAGDVLAAACDGNRGNPALFDARYFEALTDVEGDVGGRRILLREGALVETGDPGVLYDVDVPDDLGPVP